MDTKSVQVPVYTPSERQRAKIEKKLERVVQTRTLHRESRKKIPYPIVALVGCAFAWMIAQSLFSVTRTLYDRGDLDLLLGGPGERISIVERGVRIDAIAIFENAVEKITKTDRHRTANERAPGIR